MQINQVKPKVSPSRIPSIFNLIFLVFSIGLGIVISFISIFNDLEAFDWRNFFMFEETWLNNDVMLSFSFLMFTIIVMSSGIRFHILLKDQDNKISFWQSLRFGILARYYVLITPWGLGSQPILIGLMYQKGITIGKATSTVMIDLLLMRLAMSLIALMGLIFFGTLINPTLLIFAWIGFGFTCLFPVILVLASLSKPIESLMLSFIKLFFPKQSQTWNFAISSSLTQYRIVFQNYRHQSHKLWMVLLFSLVSQIALLSTSFFILSIFPQTNFNQASMGFNYVNVLMMMALANIVLGIAPTLGSAGAAEFTFTTVFSVFITGQFLVIAIFLWRFLLFYIWLILGVSFTIIEQFKLQKKMQQQQLNLTLPLKVFIFNDGFFPLIDGVVRAVDAYARYLVSQGIDVTVVVPFKGDTTKYPYRILPIPQIKIPSVFYPIPYGFNRRKIMQAISYEGPTIYHAHTPFLLGHFALRMAHKNKVPLVTTIHSKYYDDYYAATKSKFLANILKYFTIRYFSKSNAIWTVSKATVNTIKEYGLHDRSIKVITNGTDIEPIPNDEDEIIQLRKTFGIHLNTKTILFVGQLIWQKNLKLILETIKELDKAEDTYQMILVGEGRHEKDIKQYARDLSIKSHLIFTGKISNYKTLSALYSLSNLFYFPSAYDNDPLVLKEAAVHGLPSLVLSETSIANLISNNVNGFVESGSAKEFSNRIVQILANPKQLKLIGAKAKIDLVIRWPETLKDLIKNYQEIINHYYSK
jgi:glycosyltransferase involved in cell wall biosynthesis/uncharacterized membrane protein YbhN (UPF0104 family)